MRIRDPTSSHYHALETPIQSRTGPSTLRARPPTSRDLRQVDGVPSVRSSFGFDCRGLSSALLQDCSSLGDGRGRGRKGPVDSHVDVLVVHGFAGSVLEGRVLDQVSLIFLFFYEHTKSSDSKSNQYFVVIGPCIHNPSLI